MTNFFPILKATTVKGFSWQKKKRKKEDKERKAKKYLGGNLFGTKFFVFFGKNMENKKNFFFLITDIGTVHCKIVQI